MSWRTVDSAKQRYELDAEGDVLLKLYNPPAEDEEEDDDTSITSPTESNHRSIDSVDAISITKEASCINEAYLKNIASFQTTPGDDVAEYMLVSSKHMRLASPVFSAMLRPNAFKEGNSLSSNGFTEIELPDDKFEEFRIMVNIVHGLTRKVPRQLNLESLKHIAVLVNKYQMLEVIELFSDTWIRHLRRGLPTSYNEQVVDWLCIAWVFQKPKLFSSMSEILLQECDKQVEECIPVPETVRSTIEEKRVDAISKLATLISDLVAKYMLPEPRCPGLECGKHTSLACDSAFLGSLLKGSAAIGLWPTPQSPYKGLNFKKLANGIKTMRLIDLCDTSNPPYMDIHHCHGVRDSLDAEVRVIDAGMRGLDLKEFKKY